MLTSIHMVKEFNKEQVENEVNIPKAINFIDTSKSLATKKDLTIFVLDCSLNGGSSCTKRRIEAVQGSNLSFTFHFYKCFDYVML